MSEVRYYYLYYQVEAFIAKTRAPQFTQMVFDVNNYHLNQVTSGQLDSLFLEAAVENLISASYYDHLEISPVLARKVGSGVFVIHENVLRMIKETFNSVLEQFHADGINLFGTYCGCLSSCTGSFLGKFPCSQKLQKMMLLKELMPNRDVLSLIIREIDHI